VPHIDWPHALKLSLLALVSALLFTFTTLNPMPWEMVGWVVIYAAWYVALMRRRPEAPIAQGIATALLGGAWMVIVLNAFFATFLQNQPEYQAQYDSMSAAARFWNIAGTTFAFSIVLGAILGLIVRWRMRRTAALS